MCARTDDFTPNVLRGKLPWQDADPPRDKNVIVYFFAQTQDELRVLIKQGGVKVADFYTQDVGVNFAKRYTSPGGEIEYEISRCDAGKWAPCPMNVDAPILLGNFKISNVKSVIANLLFATQLS